MVAGLGLEDVQAYRWNPFLVCGKPLPLASIIVFEEPFVLEPGEGDADVGAEIGFVLGEGDADGGKGITRRW